VPLQDIRTLQMHILELESEHRELDHLIDTLDSSVARDDLAIRRLKKRKLAIKDQIRTLTQQLTPSEPA